MIAVDSRLPPADEPVVLVREPHGHEILQRIFGELCVYDELIAARAKLEERKREAPALPRPPEHALVLERISGRGLVGELWIDPHDLGNARIAFGEQGKLVTMRAITESLACSGAIEGPQLEMSASWDDVELGSSQRRFLLRRIVAMYETLAERYEGQLESDEEMPKTAPRERLAVHESSSKALVGVLENAVLRMHAEVRQGRALRGERLRRLYRRLWHLPLLALSTGRRISLEVAAAERPIELAELDLWERTAEPVVQLVAPAAEAQSGLRGALHLIGATIRHSFSAEETIRPSWRAAPAVTAEEPAKASQDVVVATPPAASKLQHEDSRPLATPEVRLLDAIRTELRMVRGGNHALLDDAHLDMLCHGEKNTAAAVYQDDGAIVLNRRHPLVERALTEFDADPMWISFLASAVYSTLNVQLAEITDPDEVFFHRLHATYISSGFGDGQ